MYTDSHQLSGLPKPEKDYISATRFAHAVVCGARGWELSNPSQSKSKVPPSAFERGSFFHAEIEKFMYTDEPVSGVIPQDIFLKLPPKSQVLPIKEEVKILKFLGQGEDITLRCIGIPDVPTHNQVFELKSGDAKEWHKWQLAYYIWLMDKDSGGLIYFDSDYTFNITNDDPTYKVTDALVMEVWLNILRKNEVRCWECSGCPLKKTCGQWSGTASPDMIDLLDAREELDRLAAEKKALDELLFAPLQARFKEAEAKVEAIKTRILDTNGVNNYSLGSHRIRIHNTTVTKLPENFVVPTYASRPDLYNPPVTIAKKLKDEFGVKSEEKRLVLEEVTVSQDSTTN